MSSHEEAVSLLDRAYATGEGGRHEISGFVFDRCGEHCGWIDSGNLQYGEVTANGMKKVYQHLDLQPGLDTFYDLGSGVGKLPMYVYLRSGGLVPSKGLEIGERRHELALMALNRLKKLGSLGEKNQSLGGNQGERQDLQAGGPHEVMDLSFHCRDISVERYCDASVVVMVGPAVRKPLSSWSFLSILLLSNLLMDGGIQKKTLEKLFKCAKFRRLITVRPAHHARLKLKTCVHVECTWARISSWHVYDVLPPAVRIPTGMANVMVNAQHVNSSLMLAAAVVGERPLEVVSGGKDGAVESESDGAGVGSPAWSRVNLLQLTTTTGTIKPKGGNLLAKIVPRYMRARAGGSRTERPVNKAKTKD
eukprot:g8646.t1